MSLVFDTSILINLERKDKRTVEMVRDLSKKHKIPAVITFITYFEFFLGIKEKSLKNQDAALNFLNKFGVLRINKATAQVLSELKYKYDRKGTVITLADMLIAAQVIENNMVLLTSDKHFERIEELKKIIL